MCGKDSSQSNVVITSGGSTPRTTIPLTADGYSTTTIDGKFQVFFMEEGFFLLNFFNLRVFLEVFL